MSFFEIYGMCLQKDITAQLTTCLSTVPKEDDSEKYFDKHCPNCKQLFIKEWHTIEKQCNNNKTRYDNMDKL
jgi:hypothetical protein